MSSTGSEIGPYRPLDIRPHQFCQAAQREGWAQSDELKDAHELFLAPETRESMEMEMGTLRFPGGTSMSSHMAHGWYRKPRNHMVLQDVCY